MNKNNIKKIILIIFIIIILLGGIFSYLYLKTDLLKTNKQLFWGYFSQNKNIIEYLDYNFNIPNYEVYSSEGEIYLETEYNGQNENTKKQYDQLKEVSVILQEEVDKTKEKQYTKIILKNKGEQLSKIEFLKDKNTYGVKNEEVADGYIAIENANLKQLAAKIEGLDETQIKDKMFFTNISKLIELTDKEKEYLKNKYTKVIMEKIGEKNYNKKKDHDLKINGKTYNTEIYSLKMNRSEYNNLKIEILENIRTDSQTLNLISTKLKMLNIPEQYTEINNLNKIIGDKINDLKSEKIEDLEDYLIYNIYVHNGKTLKNEIEIDKNIKIDITFIESEDIIIIKNNGKFSNNIIDNMNIEEIKIQKNNREGTNNLNIEISLENSKQIIMQYKKSNNNEDTIDIGIQYKTEDGYIKTIFKKVYNAKKEIDIKNFENIKNIKLNDIPEENINKLIYDVIKKHTDIFNYKIKQVNNTITQESPINVEQSPEKIEEIEQLISI